MWLYYRSGSLIVGSTNENSLYYYKSVVLSNCTTLHVVITSEISCVCALYPVMRMVINGVCHTLSHFLLWAHDLHILVMRDDR